MVSVTHLILWFASVQNNFQQTNKTEINHSIDNHIKFEVSLHFWGIWPTVRHYNGLTSITNRLKCFQLLIFCKLCIAEILFLHGCQQRHLKFSLQGTKESTNKFDLS